MLVIGHRGAAGHAPENTLLSLQCAADMGADGVEVDVRLVRGELLLLHDETLARTTGAAGRLQEWEVPALRRLDAGAGQRIPFLREVLHWLPPSMTLHAEMKGERSAPAVAELLGGGAGREPALARTVVSCFDPDQLRDLRRAEPGVRIGLLFPTLPSDLGTLAAELEPESLHLSFEGTTPESVARAHALGLKVLVYTVNEREELERVRAAGADGVFTDFPDRIRAFLG